MAENGLRPQALAPESATPETPGLSKKTVFGSLLLSFAALGLIGYYTFDVEAFLNEVEHIRWSLFAVGLGFLVLRVAFGAWRMQYASQGQLDFMHSLRGQLAWDFFSNVTPSAVGGGPFAAVYVAKDRDIPLGEASGILLFTMLLDQLVTATSTLLVLVGALFFSLLPENFSGLGMGALLIYLIGTLLYTVVLGYSTIFRPEWVQKAAAWTTSFKMLRRFRMRAIRETSHLKYRAVILRSQPARFYVIGYLLSIASWVARYLMLLFMVWSVYPLLLKGLFFMRSIAMTLASLVLPTPGGAGGIEALYYAFLSDLMPEPFLVPTLLAFRFFGYFIFIGAGGYLTLHGARRFAERLAKRKAARLEKKAHSVAQ